MGFENIVVLLSGMGLLLYGIKILGEGLELAAGAQLKTLLAKMTKNRFSAVLVGFIITTLIQSSSATTVMVVGFVNTGIMNLTQAIGVIMGANIGTTTTSILVSLDIGKFAPIAIGIGTFWMMLTKKNTHKHLASAVTGFGMLFLGMTLMKNAMAPLAASPVFSEWILKADENQNYFLAVIIGIVITATIQSSAASIGILQALALSGSIPLNFAAYVIYGQNIGTCITAVMSAFGTKKNSKRTAVMHVLFNVFGTLLFTCGSRFIPYTDWILSVTDNPMLQISLVHIIFNVVSTVIMFPFAKALVKLACLIIPDKHEESEDEFKMHFVDDLMLKTPPFAVEQIGKEVVRMANLARDNFDRAARALINNDTSKCEKIESVEDLINYLNHGITKMLVKINALDLDYSDAKYIGRLFHVINDIERIGDHAVNLSEAVQVRSNEKLAISDEAVAELETMRRCVIELLDASIASFEKQELTVEEAKKIETLETVSDNLKIKYQNAHLMRLNNEHCETRAGMMFVNTLIDFERVGDHSKNIAFAVRKKPGEKVGIDEEIVNSY